MARRSQTHAEKAIGSDERSSMTDAVSDAPVDCRWRVTVAVVPVPAPRDLVDPKGRWPVGPWRRTISPAERLAVEHVAAIAIAIRAARSGPQESQQQLAEHSGVSVATIGRIEAGRVWPDIRTVWLLLGTLGLKDWPQPDR